MIYVEDLLKKSTFAYTLQTSETDHDSGLSAGEVTWDKVRGGDFPQYRANFTADYTLPLSKAGINQSTHLYLTESFPIPTAWTPRAGTYTVEATLTNGVGEQVSDPVDTVLTFVAPNLTVDQVVTPHTNLRTGDAITYTIVFGNNGAAG